MSAGEPIVVAQPPRRYWVWAGIMALYCWVFLTIIFLGVVFTVANQLGLGDRADELRGTLVAGGATVNGLVLAWVV